MHTEDLNTGEVDIIMISLDEGRSPNTILVRLSGDCPKEFGDFINSLVSSRWNANLGGFQVHITEFYRMKQMADVLQIQDRDASDGVMERIAKWQKYRALDVRIKQGDFNEDIIPDSNMKTTMYSDQVTGVRFLSSKYRSLLADSMGIGKTLQSLYTFGLWKRSGLVKNALIISINTVKHSWTKEIKKHTNFSYTVLGNGTNGILEQLDKYEQNPTDLLITHFEGICDKANRVLDRLLTLPIDCVLIDEAHLLKNMKTRRYENISILLGSLNTCVESAEACFELEDGTQVNRVVCSNGFELGKVYDIL